MATSQIVATVKVGWKHQKKEKFFELNEWKGHTELEKGKDNIEIKKYGLSCISEMDLPYVDVSSGM